MQRWSEESQVAKESLWKAKVKHLQTITETDRYISGFLAKTMKVANKTSAQLRGLKISSEWERS